MFLSHLFYLFISPYFLSVFSQKTYNCVPWYEHKGWSAAKDLFAVYTGTRHGIINIKHLSACHRQPVSIYRATKVFCKKKHTSSNFHYFCEAKFRSLCIILVREKIFPFVPDIHRAISSVSFLKHSYINSRV